MENLLKPGNSLFAALDYQWPVFRRAFPQHAPEIEMMSRALGTVYHIGPELFHVSTRIWNISLGQR